MARIDSKGCYPCRHRRISPRNATRRMSGSRWTVAARERPRTSHRLWDVQEARPDPVRLLEEQNAERGPGWSRFATGG